MAFMDNETGEIVMQNNLAECTLDVETGECVGHESDQEMEPKQSTVRKSKFNVPRSYLVQSEPQKPREKCCLITQETYTLTSQARVIELKEVSETFPTDQLITEFQSDRFAFRKSSSDTTKPVIGCSSFHRCSSFHVSRQSFS